MTLIGGIVHGVTVSQIVKKATTIKPHEKHVGTTTGEWLTYNGKLSPKMVTNGSLKPGGFNDYCIVADWFRLVIFLFLS